VVEEDEVGGGVAQKTMHMVAIGATKPTKREAAVLREMPCEQWVLR
jgi:hypothetical protein